jgi:hypothetical protein
MATVLSVLVGCGGSTEATDSGVDATSLVTDGGSDAADLTTDAGRDAASPTDDAGADTGTDGGTDASTTDGGTDASSAGPCACTLGATCIEGSSPASCATVLSTCSGGTTSVACDPVEAEASCVRGASTTYYYWARTNGRLATARTSCTTAVGGSAGVFSVATIPAPSGSVCSCMRTASACVETHGASCTTLACTPGLQTTACDATGHVPGRCVSRDGQTEIVYYGIAASLAESTCHSASSSGELYWLPDGIDAP